MVKYKTPSLEVIYFETEDIVTVSNGEGDGDLPLGGDE